MSKQTISRFRSALELLQPAFLSGFTLPQWIRLLNENSWDIDAKYLPRAVAATLGSVATTCLKPFEPSVELDEEGEKLWQRPVFILGLPRSGTTHLFNLMAQDPQFVFPARIDCYNPHTFLLLRKLGLHQLLAMVPTKRRFMDNMRTGWLLPEEDNIALSILTGEGSRLMQVFPKNEAYRSDFGPDGVMSECQRALFLEAINIFSKKLVYTKRACPLFKSPNHTRYIPEILQAFPDAKFLTILRNPFDQFASHKAMNHSASGDWSALQKKVPISDDERLKWISSILHRYGETRTMIPYERLCEVRYSELVQGQGECLREIYTSLDLGNPPTQHIRAIQETYKKNSHPKLSPELESKIRKVYEPFESLGFFDGNL